MGQFKIALVQMNVTTDKQENVNKAVTMISEAAQQGADIVSLPEIFNSPYKASDFPLYAEERGGFTWRALSDAARKNSVYLVGGSIPELDQSKVYNTSFVFDRGGNEIAMHRKVHLFDINITNGQVFRESDTLTAGNRITVFETEFCRMGVLICYDIRFPELARLMALNGAEVIFCPAAFNMTTGPAHWELTMRMRALDNQVYLAAAAPARNVNANYVSYANSIMTSPWGEVVGRLDEHEGILIREIDLDRIRTIRTELPLLKHRRTDLYELKAI